MSEKTESCSECSRGELAEKFCLDCTTLLCQPCIDHHQHSKKLQSHRMVLLTGLTPKEDGPIQSKYPLCGEHDYELKHYCETCDQLVCLYCTMKEHNGHNHDVIRKMVEKRKQDNRGDEIISRDGSGQMRKKLKTNTTQGNNNDKVCKEFPQDVITLYHQVEKLESGIDQRKTESEQQKNQTSLQINQLKPEVDPLKQMLNAPYKKHTNTTTQPIEGPKTSKLKIEAPPLMPALTSGRYHIKWTQLANLPAPMYNACATVQDKKVYVAGGFIGFSPVDHAKHQVAKHQVYVYDVNTDHWDQLPPSGHYVGVPHIIGGKLAIIGGLLSATKMMTNKVSTFDETRQTWTSHYPDLLSVRYRPGVVTHLEHVIVAGGGKYVNNTLVLQDDIEVLNWMENSHWQEVSINLPVSMASFTPIISDDHLLIVNNNTYKIPVDDITRSGNQQQTSDTPTKWITMTNAACYNTALVPSSSPPVVVGGNQSSAPTSDIKMYNDSSKSWKNISSLSSVRCAVAIAAVNNNAIIVIGGYTTKGGDNARSPSLTTLTTVELGQAELIQ